VRLLNFLLSLFVLIGVVMAARWYMTTPQPIGLAAQGVYLRDTVVFEIKRHRDPLPQDPLRQIDYWRPLAEKQNSLAQLQIAQLLFSQAVRNRDLYAQAAGYLRPAAERSVPLAQNALGVMYRDGLGMKQDRAEAYKWFTLSAERGLTLAEENRLALAHQMTPADVLRAQQLALTWLIEYRKRD
jgi:TPR repeat protein